MKPFWEASRAWNWMVKTPDHSCFSGWLEPCPTNGDTLDAFLTRHTLHLTSHVLDCIEATGAMERLPAKMFQLPLRFDPDPISKNDPMPSYHFLLCLSSPSVLKTFQKLCLACSRSQGRDDPVGKLMLSSHAASDARTAQSGPGKFRDQLGGPMATYTTPSLGV